MFKKLATLLAGAALVMTASSAMALTLNSGRPATIGTSSETSLQTVLNNNFDNSLDAANSQSNVAAWTQSEGDSSIYRVAFFAGDSGFLSVYSLSDPTKTAQLIARTGTPNTGTFRIDSNGKLEVNNGYGSTIENFGKVFGFFWTDSITGTKSYTEDDKNAHNEILALTYRVADGTKLTGNLGSQLSGASAGNNNDWVLAFEDVPGGDHDYQDAVIYVEDISAVPEPGTMVLLGAGMLGLAIFGKRRINREA